MPDISASLDTPRLILRQWHADDYEPFAALNADPKVMEYFPGILDRSESDDMAEIIKADIKRRGWGLWAVEEKDSTAFIGFVGLHEPRVDLSFTPCVEIGWRLAYKFWGKGYATEAAQRALAFGFETLDLLEIVSFTTTGNLRSQRVMKKLGLHNTHQNFQHPSVPEASSLREHVLYTINQQEWKQTQCKTRY